MYRFLTSKEKYQCSLFSKEKYQCSLFSIFETAGNNWCWRQKLTLAFENWILSWVWFLFSIQEFKALMKYLMIFNSQLEIIFWILSELEIIVRILRNHAGQDLVEYEKLYRFFRSMKRYRENFKTFCKAILFQTR